MPHPINLYNSLSNEAEEFKPTDPSEVKIYHCGPTVYKRQHIGNMRRYLFADFLRRSLEFMGYGVKEVTNITDVGHLTQDDIDAGEDKLAKAAKAEKTTPEIIAAKQTDLFFEDLKALNIQQSNVYPRATKHIQDMQDLITMLIDSGHAYVTETGAYYDVTSFADYGKLSGNTLEKLAAGSRIEVRAEKRNPSDFALWIFDEEALQKWDSPWGTGYPGWHIECSAMSEKHLGRPIDIHTGGHDNRFPHHENEIAQSEGASDNPFVNLWMHGGLLQMDGAKMAKSEGEQITLDTLKEKGYSPLAFRLLVFGSHYRSSMEFSWEAMDGAREYLSAMRYLVRRVIDHEDDLTSSTGDIDEDTLRDFRDAIADDINTPAASAVMSRYVSKALQALNSDARDDTTLISIWPTMMEMDKVLGIFGQIFNEMKDDKVPAAVKEKVDRREMARKSKDFTESDRLRDEIAALGYIVEDTGGEPRIIKKDD